MSTRLALIFGGFALAGVLQLALARWLARRTRALMARGKRASGRRVGSARQTGVDGRGSRHDVVEFTSEDGQRREVTSRIGVPWSTDKDKEITVLYDPADPAVLRLIRMVVEAAGKAGIDVNVCGEMSGEPLYIPLLVGLGLRSLSATPRKIPEIKRVIRQLSLPEAESVARQALTMDTARQVQNLLRDNLRRILPEAVE